MCEKEQKEQPVVWRRKGSTCVVYCSKDGAYIPRTKPRPNTIAAAIPPLADEGAAPLLEEAEACLEMELTALAKPAMEVLWPTAAAETPVTAAVGLLLLELSAAETAEIAAGAVTPVVASAAAEPAGAVRVPVPAAVSGAAALAGWEATPEARVVELTQRAQYEFAETHVRPSWQQEAPVKSAPPHCAHSAWHFPEAAEAAGEEAAAEATGVEAAAEATGAEAAAVEANAVAVHVLDSGVHHLVVDSDDAGSEAAAGADHVLDSGVHHFVADSEDAGSDAAAAEADHVLDSGVHHFVVDSDEAGSALLLLLPSCS